MLDLRTSQAAIAAADAVEALDALQRGTAWLDLAGARLGWCSPGFEACCKVPAGTAFDEVGDRIPGLADAVARMAAPSATPSGGRRGVNWELTCGPAAGQVADAVMLRPDAAVLRLRDQRKDGPSFIDALAVRRHLEDRERLLFTSRTLSVSEMASTLAHELNQPIGTIANVLRGIKLRLEGQAAPDILAPGVQLALDQALFASRIITRIRDYTHSRQPKRERLDLVEVVGGSLALLDWEVRRDGVRVDMALPPQACPILGDAVMLQQLFVNLLRNAIEAMRDGPSDERVLHLRLYSPPDGGDVEVAIRDSGCGLPPDAETRLFVPFQSTKPNGMGIGLNICRSFAELHQGRLWFTRNSAADGGPRGSTFHVSLPCAEPGAEPAMRPT